MSLVFTIEKCVYTTKPVLDDSSGEGENIFRTNTGAEAGRLGDLGVDERGCLHGEPKITK